MAEEQGGLSYTIRFIPDTTAIDIAITDIAKRVGEEVGQAIRKARITAGVEEGVPTEAAPIGGVGIVDRLIGEFRSVKERITGMMQKYGILAGEAMALGHPTGRTVGAVMERLREKLAVTPLEDLSEDMRLLIGAATTVVAQRIKAMQELRPDLSKEEATKMVMGEPIGTLKGIATGEGFKQYATMRALAEIERSADYYGRTLKELGEAAPKSVLKALMGIVTHKFAAEVGKRVLDADGRAPDWVAEEIPWTEVYKYLGATEDQIKELGIAERIRAADRFRLADGIKIDEFGGIKTGRDFSRDVRMAHQLFKTILETPRMTKRVEEITGRPIEELDVEAVLATVPFGAAEVVVGAEEVDRPGLTATLEDITEAMRAAISEEVGGEDRTLEILDVVHKIFESLGTSPTPAVLPSGPPEGFVGDMEDTMTKKEE